MRVAALVPFKRFTRAKRRLRTEYSETEVEAIGRAMLSDVLGALGNASGLERIEVLTDDDAVAEVAKSSGAEVRLSDPDPGLNAAIDAATSELIRKGIDASLVVLGDLPLLRPTDICDVIERGERHPVIIVPSLDGGTAMLYRRPPDRIQTLFGKESAAAHTATAREQAVDVLVHGSIDAYVRLDLDTPEDVKRFLESQRPCHTRDALLALRS